MRGYAAPTGDRCYAVLYEGLDLVTGINTGSPVPPAASAIISRRVCVLSLAFVIDAGVEIHDTESGLLRLVAAIARNAPQRRFLPGTGNGEPVPAREPSRAQVCPH
jgi:hypothetical protein